VILCLLNQQINFIKSYISRNCDYINNIYTPANGQNFVSLNSITNRKQISRFSCCVDTIYWKAVFIGVRLHFHSMLTRTNDYATTWNISANMKREFPIEIQVPLMYLYNNILVLYVLFVVQLFPCLRQCQAESSSDLSNLTLPD